MRISTGNRAAGNDVVDAFPDRYVDWANRPHGSRRKFPAELRQ